MIKGSLEQRKILRRNLEQEKILEQEEKIKRSKEHRKMEKEQGKSEKEQAPKY